MAVASKFINDRISNGFADTSSRLANDQYKFNYTIFPSDIGMSNQGHYMIININVPVKGVHFFEGIGGAQVAGNFADYVTDLRQASKMDILRFGGNPLNGAQRPLTKMFPNQAKRIAESIVLHMPNGLVFRTDNEYQNIGLSSIVGKAGSLISGLAGNKSGLGAAIGVAGQVAGAAASASQFMENPVNPMIEVLFANTAQRQFTFDFLLAPRNEYESQAIQNIYTTLKFHGAPEINATWTGGFGATWIPPAIFDITFFHQGVENTKMPRINTCALEVIVLDPMPTGQYATFSNGHPVAWRMGLGFRELEIIHKDRVLQGF